MSVIRTGKVLTVAGQQKFSAGQWQISGTISSTYVVIRNSGT